MESYDDSLIIEFYEGSTPGNTSYYDNGVHKIKLKSVMSINHEYIHSLTMKYCKNELWAYEGFATYYSPLYNSYANDFLNYDCNYYMKRMII